MTTAAKRIGREDAALAVKLWALAKSAYVPARTAEHDELYAGLLSTGDPIGVVRALADAMVEIAETWAGDLPPPPTPPADCGCPKGPGGLCIHDLNRCPRRGI